SSDRGRRAAWGEGRVHRLQLNTGAVPAAVNAGGFVPLVAPADENGRCHYEMEFIVPRDSPYRSLDDFRAACAARPAPEERPKLALGDVRSHSGFKAPLVLLWKEYGLLAGRDFEYVNSGTPE